MKRKQKELNLKQISDVRRNYSYLPENVVQQIFSWCN